MEPKRDTKSGEESNCRFKIDIWNLTSFGLNTRKSLINISNFNGFLFSKLYIF